MSLVLCTKDKFLVLVPGEISVTALAVWGKIQPSPTQGWAVARKGL